MLLILVSKYTAETIHEVFGAKIVHASVKINYSVRQLHSKISLMWRMGRSCMIIRIFRPDQTSDMNLITFEFKNDTFSLVNALIFTFPFAYYSWQWFTELRWTTFITTILWKRLIIDPGLGLIILVCLGYYLHLCI